MMIGLLTVRLHIPESNSLKEKRMVIKSLKDKLRNRFNVSVSEVANHDKWQLADIAVANVSSERVSANRALNIVLNFIEDCKDVDIIDYHLELF